MKISFQTYKVQEWFGGDIMGVVELARRADELGVHQVNMVEHILMGTDFSNYPYGDFGVGPEYPWFETISVLSAIAAVTRNIRLSTGVMISPLRPAPLLAKQLATLDNLSRGRVDIGIGPGWQRAEYDAASIPWERRFSRMTDQLRACKALWTQAPASHHGEFYSFDNVYSTPFPVQPGGVPIWFGFALNDRNLDRIAELGDGWLPARETPAQMAEGIRRIKDAMAAKGRDPDRLQVRAGLHGPPGRRSDLNAALDRIPELAAAGATVVEISPAAFCKSPEQAEDLFKAAVAAGAEADDTLTPRPSQA
ncbi:TIGR03619 family F420-dependent LLM class oxidoreductase [Phenylobacterium sp.]|jgi:probable F420-dependent oxidoreductase|uniref:TIGR03619 family F420-dependent LLM class oxidoreductase n=1 Tax=Phenylobacterium sp. TaxID=1871053 RepID=UPI002F40E90E